MTDNSTELETTGSSTTPDVDDGSVERVDFRVPGWVRRGGTTSWMMIGMLIALAVLIGLIAATRDITGPLAIGVFLAIVFVPIVNWLEEHGIGRALGAGIVLVGLVVVIGGAGLVTAEALGSQSDVLKENLDAAVEEVKTIVEDLPISDAAVDEVDSTASDAGPVVRDGVATAVAGAVSTAAGLITGLILGAMVLYYLLKDGPMLTRRWVDAKADRADRDATERIVNKALQDVQGYFGGKTALALVNGVSIAIGMYFLGVPGALAIGVVNVIGAYIPYIGAFFGGAFAVLMALGEGGIGLAVAAFALVMVAQLVLENLLEPKLLGSSLNLHPLTILLATTLGGMAAGMVGLILAAPVVAIGVDLKKELTAVGFFDDDDG
ncbi:AI-2E family transporter [Ilumatobacter sp.]|uniref:AI-2E family transporter n=1 Tax=Ilumatobacter sp. TaxID=1967498 RepID=UPI003AF87E31